MTTPVSFQPQGPAPQLFGSVAQRRPAFGAARDTVQFGASRDENQKLLDDMRNREKAKPQKKGSFAKGVMKGFKYWLLSAIPAAVVGLPLMVLGIPTGGLSAIPGCAILLSPVLIGTLGFLKGKMRG